MFFLLSFQAEINDQQNDAKTSHDDDDDSHPSTVVDDVDDEANVVIDESLYSRQLYVLGHQVGRFRPFH